MNQGKKLNKKSQKNKIHKFKLWLQKLFSTIFIFLQFKLIIFVLAPNVYKQIFEFTSIEIILINKNMLPS